MFSCKECGKEFGDWHALGGHMRTHRPRTGDRARSAAGPEAGEERVVRALGRLGDLSAEEAWRIVVNWIFDVYREAHARDEAIQAYRLRLRESEARMDGIQSDLKKLQEMVSAVGRGPAAGPAGATQMRWTAMDESVGR